MKTRANTWLLFAFILTLLCPTGGRSEVPIDRDKAARVKAAYLYHLARLTSWPADTIPADGDSLQICIVGEDPHDLVGLFRRSGHNLRAGRYPLSIERRDPDRLQDDRPTDLSRYQVVFFTESARDQAHGLLAAGAPPGVLLVGESDGFCEHGGMVGFAIVGGRVRIEVNRKALHDRSLRLSAEFMQHATLVESAPREVD
jgi:hypothetical protein